MGDEVSDAFDAFDRRWAERQGVFEQRTHHRELELVVMPGQDARALEVARRRAVPRRCSRTSGRCATIRAARTPFGGTRGTRSSTYRSMRAEGPLL
jgi:hypothetical protein